MTASFRTPAEAGFTMMELLLVLILVGILAGTLMTHVNLSFDNSENAAALRRAESSVRVRVAHVQNEAMRRRTECSVQFGAGTMEASCGGSRISLAGEASAAPYGEGIVLGRDSISGFSIQSNGIISHEGRKPLRLEKDGTTREFTLVTGVM